MAEGVVWTKRLQRIAKWALLGVIGLAVGLLAVLFGLSFFYMILIIAG